MDSFAHRLQDRLRRFGALCVGIDPSRDLLIRAGLPDSADGLFEFGKRVLESVDYKLSIVKPQVAYFERHGSRGIAALEELNGLGRSRDVLMLLDAKRGDIDSTGEAYAEAYFAPSSTLLTDAMTVSAYMGLGALDKLIDIAHKTAGGVFVVVRSSNPEGEASQLARLPDGRTVAEKLCAEITAANVRLAGTPLGPIGAVVGATCDDAAQTVERMPHSFILAPGIGAQGATFDDVRRRMPNARGRILASVSRAILKGGTDQAAIGATIRALQADAQGL
jgi:orotidine-5'-phosphate decarboxylase